MTTSIDLLLGTTRLVGLQKLTTETKPTRNHSHSNEKLKQNKYITMNKIYRTEQRNPNPNCNSKTKKTKENR